MNWTQAHKVLTGLIVFSALVALGGIASAVSAGAASGASTSVTKTYHAAATASSGAYVNPIGSGLTPGRIDMGVDYTGSGSLYALGSGTVVSLYNSGWPGGTFLCIKLDINGLYVYYAEDIKPLVSVGQHVTAGEYIANATGGSSGIEIGWAKPRGHGITKAHQAGQDKLGREQGDPGLYTCGYGLAMNSVLTALGAPGGFIDNPIQGSAPAKYSTIPGSGSVPLQTV